MPRNRPRKTDRSTKDLFLYQQAYEEVCKGRSIRAAARMFDLCHVSLSRYKQKRENASEGHTVTMGYKPASKVFTEDQEQSIFDYLIRTADIYFGLSPKEVRRLAFDLAKHYQISRPETWDENKIASEDWFSGFMKRHPELSIRCAQATSLSRATSFNRSNVEPFFNNLATVFDRYKFEPQDIYNMDETGVTTVHKPDRIVTRSVTDMRQVGAVTSGERGTLVTITVAVNAIGNAIPVMFVFPRIHYQPHFVRDGLIGCIGAGNKSGWMEEREFLVFLEHFKRYSNASLDHKVLLTLDNHPSHITIAALDYCKNNGIIMLSFPPHCTHKLQPVDRSVNGPLKKAINSACTAWMRNHPGRPMTIHDIPAIVDVAYPIALTPRNIIINNKNQGGFRVTGIFPYNRDIFDDAEYSPSFVTDRPDPTLTNPGELTPSFGAVTPPRLLPSSNDPLASNSHAELLTFDDEVGRYSYKSISTDQNSSTKITALATQVNKTYKVTQEDHNKLMSVKLVNSSEISSSSVVISSYMDPLASTSHFETPLDELTNQTTNKISKSSNQVTELGKAALMVVTNMLTLTETSSYTPLRLDSFSNDPLAFYQPPESHLSETITSKNICHNLTYNQAPVTISLPETEVSQSRKAEQVLSGTVNYQAGSSTPVKATSSSIVTLPSTSRTLHFSPDIVRPLPKAPPRKNNTRGRKRGKSAIYTDTPEKEAIRNEHEEKERKKRAKGVKKTISKSTNVKGKKQKKQNPKKKETDSESEEEEWFCIVCMEAYSNSKSNEIWIQCSQCRLWAHECCTPQIGFSYTCHNCDSDDSD